MYRPVDVAIAPDGSLFIADWNDPGVGGHRMGDMAGDESDCETTKDRKKYHISEPDFASLGGASVTGKSEYCDQIFSPGGLRSIWLVGPTEIDSHRKRTLVAANSGSSRMAIGEVR